MGVAPCQVGQGKPEEWGHTTVRHNHSSITLTSRTKNYGGTYIPLVQEVSVGEVHGFVGGLVDQEGVGSGQDHP